MTDNKNGLQIRNTTIEDIKDIVDLQMVSFPPMAEEGNDLETT
jgi:hypothetical protein